METDEIIRQKEYIKKVYEINKGKILKYTILTMGCQLNENDSEKLMGMAEEMGYVKTDNPEKADLYLINTCCVRENAEEKLFGKIGELKNKKENKNIIIAIGGCMMQEEHITKKIKTSYPFVDIIFGTHTLHKLPEDIYNAIIKKEKIKDIIDINGKVYEGIPVKRTDNKKALVTIMYGCNNFCSYCIVPYVRGRERSRNEKDILKEVKDLAKEGYKEITFLGQNVNSYKGSKKDYGFASLLKDICKIDGIEIVRFVSPHPKDFTEDVIEAIRDNKKISRLIHVPLQSGSTSVLKEMNRKYTKEQYLNLIDRIKTKIPDAVFSTDIIVGFPGETEKDFEDTLDVARKVNFEQIFMFIYSRRVGTRADKMENQVPDEVKHKRFDRLKELYEERIEENNKKYIGTIQRILVEGNSKNNNDMLSRKNRYK